MLLERVIRAGPSAPHVAVTAYLELGDIDMDDQAYAEAARHYALAAAADPDDLTPLNNMAVALIAGGRPDTARIVLAAAIHRNPSRAPLYKNMGLAWLRSGEPDSALAWLDRAERRDPRLASVWQVRAEVAARKGDTSGARAGLARYIALGGDSASAAALADEIGLGTTH
jgi:predicted Zn-dependent protease